MTWIKQVPNNHLLDRRRGSSKTRSVWVQSQALFPCRILNLGLCQRSSEILPAQEHSILAWTKGQTSMNQQSVHMVVFIGMVYLRRPKWQISIFERLPRGSEGVCVPWFIFGVFLKAIIGSSEIQTQNSTQKPEISLARPVLTWHMKKLRLREAESFM